MKMDLIASCFIRHMHSGYKCVYVMSTTAESRLSEVLETKYIISNYQEVDIKLYNLQT